MGLWFAPVAIAVLAAVPIFVLLRRTSREAARLREAIAELGALREPIADLRDDAHALRAGVPQVRGRSRPAGRTGP